MKMHIPGMIRDTGSFAGGATHGKGGGGAQTSTVNQSNLPAYARPYFERIMNRSEAASNRPYEAYPGQRVAEASNDMNASYEGARNLQNTYLPSFNQASEAYTDALGQAGRAVSGYDPNVEMFGQDAAQRYMNPYIGNVISQAQQAAQQNFLESQGGRASQAVKSGAFGGSRATIADEVARRTYDSQFQSLTADLLDKGYSNAQAQFMADRTARDNANQYAAKLGMEGAAFGLQAGQRMQGLGESAFGMAGKQANLLKTTEEVDIVRREIVRLEGIGPEGIVAVKTILERKYELQKLEAVQLAQRQALQNQSLSASQTALPCFFLPLQTLQAQIRQRVLPAPDPAHRRASTPRRPKRLAHRPLACAAHRPRC